MFLPGKSPGQRSLAGYTAESDMTEQLNNNKEFRRSLGQCSRLRPEDTKVEDVEATFAWLGLYIGITSYTTEKLFTRLSTFSMSVFTVSHSTICWKKFVNPVVLNHTYETYRMAPFSLHYVCILVLQICLHSNICLKVWGVVYLKHGVLIKSEQAE